MAWQAAVVSGSQPLQQRAFRLYTASWKGQLAALLEIESTADHGNGADDAIPSAHDAPSPLDTAKRRRASSILSRLASSLGLKRQDDGDDAADTNGKPRDPDPTADSVVMRPLAILERMSAFVCRSSPSDAFGCDAIGSIIQALTAESTSMLAPSATASMAKREAVHFCNRAFVIAILGTAVDYGLVTSESDMNMLIRLVIAQRAVQDAIGHTDHLDHRLAKAACARMTSEVPSLVASCRGAQRGVFV